MVGRDQGSSEEEQGAGSGRRSGRLQSRGEGDEGPGFPYLCLLLDLIQERETLHKLDGGGRYHFQLAGSALCCLNQRIVLLTC